MIACWVLKNSSSTSTGCPSHAIQRHMSVPPRRSSGALPTSTAATRVHASGRPGSAHGFTGSRLTLAPIGRSTEDATMDQVLHGLPGEVTATLRRHASAALIPAAVLGAGTDVVEVLRHHLGAEIALG